MVTPVSSPILQRGFTLVELLIATAVGILILSTLVTFWSTTAKVTVVAALSRTTLEDVRSAGNYMTDMINQANYVFPPNANLTLASTSAYSVQNPTTSTSIWTVGTHPIVAMFLPPDDTTACNTASAFSSRGCIKFMAFYAVKRAVVMANATGAERPNEDPFIPSDGWTIYQYIQNITPPPPVSPITDSVTQLVTNLKSAGTLTNYTTSGISGNLLADYIDNNGFAISIQECYTAKNNFTSTGCPTTNATAIKSALAVNMTLQSRIPRGKSDALSDQVKIPSSPMIYRATPRNLLDPL